MFLVRGDLGRAACAIDPNATSAASHAGVGTVGQPLILFQSLDALDDARRPQT
jgi:hypothetical protein